MRRIIIVTVFVALLSSYSFVFADECDHVFSGGSYEDYVDGVKKVFVSCEKCNRDIDASDHSSKKHYWTRWNLRVSNPDEETYDRECVICGVTEEKTEKAPLTPRKKAAKSAVKKYLNAMKGYNTSKMERYALENGATFPKKHIAKHIKRLNKKYMIVRITDDITSYEYNQYSGYMIKCEITIPNLKSKFKKSYRRKTISNNQLKTISKRLKKTKKAKTRVIKIGVYVVKTSKGWKIVENTKKLRNIAIGCG